MTARQTCRAALLAAACTIAALPAAARELGLVVGINAYAAFPEWVPGSPAGLYDLQGAVNDARRIAGAMRIAGIHLPESRVLLDERATKAGFLAAWRELLAEATPGDTLVVTYAGHGGQEREVSAPFDEADGRDETLMFHDFDPDAPREGRLNDDELRALLSEASAFRVLWVMDSCHSAGLSRSTSDRDAMGQTRSGGLYDIPVEPALTEIKAEEGDEDEGVLAHVTQILATETESKLVQETRIDGQLHGALSYYFAEALLGEADLDSDGIMTRSELAAYLQDRVFTRMNQTQQPRILPRGDAEPVFAPPPEAAAAPPLSFPSDRVPVRIDGTAPPGLDLAAVSFVDTGAVLTFRESGAAWQVLNHTGDRITTITGGADRLVQRARFLDALERAKTAHLPPVNIRAEQDVAAQKLGAAVGFVFHPPNPEHPYLTLFNVASDGMLQYPLAALDAPVSPKGHRLAFRVAPPTGADELVAVFCSRPPIDLRRALQAGKGATVSPVLLHTLANQSCQIGRIGLYTID